MLNNNQMDPDLKGRAAGINNQLTCFMGGIRLYIALNSCIFYLILHYKACFKHNTDSGKNNLLVQA